MAMQGPDIDAMALKYSSEEKAKFKAIIDANQSGNNTLAEQLASKLSSDENIKFDQFLADLETVRQYQEVLQAQKAQSDARIAQLDQELIRLEKNGEAITHQYQKDMAAALGNVSVNGKPANGNASTPTNRSYDSGLERSSGSAEKKHRGCTIL